MDVRYTGHYYDLLTSLGDFAKEQPRKGMWERNSRFYIPKFHRTYPDFREHVQSKYESDGGRKDDSIWGPNAPPKQPVVSWDDLPPLTAEHPQDDKFEWGVGEEADLITLLPQFDPGPTHYVLRHGHWNYPKDLAPKGPPRRATIVTFYRLSHRLLSAMHLENSHAPGHHMSAESWPQSVALHHGFKSIYAPHSIYLKAKWPAQALEFTFNNGDSDRYPHRDAPRDGHGSGGPESIFGLDREHPFRDSTFYYRNNLGKKLYKQFMGYEVNGIGGPEVRRLFVSSSGTFC